MWENNSGCNNSNNNNDNNNNDDNNSGKYNNNNNNYNSNDDNDNNSNNYNNNNNNDVELRSADLGQYICSTWQVMSAVRVSTCSTVVPLITFVAAILLNPPFNMAVWTTCSGEEDVEVPSLLSWKDRRGRREKERRQKGKIEEKKREGKDREEKERENEEK